MRRANGGATPRPPSSMSAYLNTMALVYNIFNFSIAIAGKPHEHRAAPNRRITYFIMPFEQDRWPLDEHDDSRHESEGRASVRLDEAELLVAAEMRFQKLLSERLEPFTLLRRRVDRLGKRLNRFRRLFAQSEFSLIP